MILFPIHTIGGLTEEERMDQLMNTKEVAAYLGIHEKKVYYLVKGGGSHALG